MRTLGKIAAIVAITAMFSGCQNQTETIYKDETTPTVEVRAWGLAQFYHVAFGDEIKSYYVGQYDVSDTVKVKLPATDSALVGAENTRGIEWQWVAVKADSLYRFKTK